MTRHRPTEDRRREIANAALHLLASEGPKSFTASRLAREVGLTDAALFYHFEGKGGILLAVIDLVEEILFEGFPPTQADPVERLRAFFLSRAAVFLTFPGLGRLMHSDIFAQLAPEEGARRVTAFKRRTGEFIQACLHEATETRLLAEGVGVVDAALLIQGSLLAFSQFADPAEDNALLPGVAWANLSRALFTPGGECPER